MELISSQGGSETKSSSVAAGYQNFIVCIGKISLITTGTYLQNIIVCISKISLITYWYLLANFIVRISKISLTTYVFVELFQNQAQFLQVSSVRHYNCFFF
jgi:hypothetical protein